MAVKPRPDGYVRLTLPRVDGYAVVRLVGAEKDTDFM